MHCSVKNFYFTWGRFKRHEKKEKKRKKKKCGNYKGQHVRLSWGMLLSIDYKALTKYFPKVTHPQNNYIKNNVGI